MTPVWPGSGRCRPRQTRVRAAGRPAGEEWPEKTRSVHTGTTQLEGRHSDTCSNVPDPGDTRPRERGQSQKDCALGSAETRTWESEARGRAGGRAGCGGVSVYGESLGLGDDGGGGCTAARMRPVPLHCALEHGEKADFIHHVCSATAKQEQPAVPCGVCSGRSTAPAVPRPAPSPPLAGAWRMRLAQCEDDR